MMIKERSVPDVNMTGCYVDRNFAGKKPLYSIGERAVGPNLPMQQAMFKAGALTNKPIGVLLALHGCEKTRPGYANKGHRSWLQFFRRKGFVVILPTSYAEKRPASLCGLPSWERATERDDISRIRIGQANRTVENLRKEYPGLPIVIWGHSEGGHTALNSGADVDAIVTTGGPLRQRHAWADRVRLFDPAIDADW